MIRTNATRTVFRSVDLLTNVRLQAVSGPSRIQFPRPNPRMIAIVFESYRDGHAEVYRMNADGTGVERLTHFDGQVTEDGGFPPGNGNPCWSPK